MGKHQTRRTVSLNGAFFEKLTAFCRAQGRAVSEFTEHTLAEKMKLDETEIAEPHDTFGVEAGQIWVSRKSKRYRVMRVYQRPTMSMCSLKLADGANYSYQMTCRHLVKHSGYRLESKLTVVPEVKDKTATAPETKQVSVRENRILIIADRVKANPLLRPPSTTVFVGAKPTPASLTPARDEPDPWSSHNATAATARSRS